ncbi:hypothetical protein B0A48_04536 [Cryoendolithus antarcticus]|uniref:Uncharacterized protein n=1 Tax=Cryoendolithus antarcticus TaxID=1507870 RepID=A0A1V8TFM0_9PEZI|nr:hypothetical protein B0A48_04536 [Cryoendolithus antarcticus]
MAPSTRSKRGSEQLSAPPPATTRRNTRAGSRAVSETPSVTAATVAGILDQQKGKMPVAKPRTTRASCNTSRQNSEAPSITTANAAEVGSINTATAADVASMNSKNFKTTSRVTRSSSRNNSRAGSEVPLEALATISNAKTTRSSSRNNSSASIEVPEAMEINEVTTTTTVKTKTAAHATTRVTRSSSRNSSCAGSERPSSAGQDVITVSNATITKRKTRAGSVTSIDDTGGDTLKGNGKGAKRPRVGHRTFAKMDDITQYGLSYGKDYIEPSIEQHLPVEASIEDYQAKRFGPPEHLVKDAKDRAKGSSQQKERSFGNEGLIKLGDASQPLDQEEEVMERLEALDEVGRLAMARGRAELDDDADMIAEFERGSEEDKEKELTEQSAAAEQESNATSQSEASAEPELGVQQEQDASSYGSQQEQEEVSPQLQDLPYEEVASQQDASSPHLQSAETEQSTQHTPQATQQEQSTSPAHIQSVEKEQSPEHIQQQQYISPPLERPVEHDDSPPRTTRTKQLQASQEQQSQQDQHGSSEIYKPYKTHRNANWATPRPQRNTYKNPYLGTGNIKPVRRKPSFEEQKEIDAAAARLRAEQALDLQRSPLLKPKRLRTLVRRSEQEEQEFSLLDEQPDQKSTSTYRSTSILRKKALQDEIAAYKAKKEREAAEEAEHAEAERVQAERDVAEQSSDQAPAGSPHEHTPSNKQVTVTNGEHENDDVDYTSTPMPAEPKAVGYLSGLGLGNLVSAASPWKITSRLSSLFSPAKKPAPTKIEKATTPATKTRIAKQKLIQKGKLSSDQAAQQQESYRDKKVQAQSEGPQERDQQMSSIAQPVVRRHGGISGVNHYGYDESDFSSDVTDIEEEGEHYQRPKDGIDEDMASGRDLTPRAATHRKPRVESENDDDMQSTPKPPKQGNQAPEVNTDAVKQTRQRYDLDTMDFPETSNDSNGFQPMRRDQMSAGDRFAVKQAVYHGIKRKRPGCVPLGLPIDNMATISESPELPFQTPARAADDLDDERTAKRQNTGLVPRVPRARRTVKAARAAREAAYIAAHPRFKPCWAVDEDVPVPPRDRNADSRKARLDEADHLRNKVAADQKALAYLEANYEVAKPRETKWRKAKHLKVLPARLRGECSGSFRVPDWDDDDLIEVDIDAEECESDWYGDDDEVATPKASTKPAATPGSMATATPMSIDTTTPTPAVSNPFANTNAPLPSQQAATTKIPSPVDDFALFIPMLKQGHVSFFDRDNDPKVVPAPLPTQPAATTTEGYMYFDSAPPPLSPDELVSDRDEDIDLLFEEEEDWPAVTQGDGEVMTQEEEDEAWVEGRKGFVGWLEETGQVRNFGYKGEQWVGQWDGLAKPVEA